MTSRALEQVFDISCKEVGSKGFKLVLIGQNTSGKAFKVNITLEWMLVPYLIQEIYKAWRSNRSFRIQEINQIDAALKGAEQIN